MKPTSDNFEPRRDGWFEHKGTWGEVTVGTVLATDKRTERWEVIATAHGEGQIPLGYTLWFQIREMTTGEIHPVAPKFKMTPARILTRDPADTRTAPPTDPTDSEALEILVRELGAEVLASRDETTGEITCPDYINRSHIPGTGNGQKRQGLIEHMKFAHGLVTPIDISIEDAITLHGKAHDSRYPDIGKSGFPHRHVPEDLSMF